ncbi:unnamed protein product [Mesocestoides corti]|uniref:DUF4604 domain-containing protein n=1 Tax=Mesocestoides corti TaxID=53468 RepID=A0A0R3U270_MESCO|nr:unnamed protein product [Mesocestoides corti]
MPGKGMRKRVEAIEVEEPAFIKRFREQSGMRPEANIKSKRAKREVATGDDFRDREDEAPQVVAGVGVSEEEAKKFVEENLARKRPEEKADAEAASHADDAENSGKILFRKPKPRNNESNEKKSGAGKATMEKLKKRTKDDKSKESGTLSFSYDDDDDND